MRLCKPRQARVRTRACSDSQLRHEAAASALIARRIGCVLCVCFVVGVLCVVCECVCVCTSEVQMVQELVLIQRVVEEYCVAQLLKC